jgi:hypothetical protein
MPVGFGCVSIRPRGNDGAGQPDAVVADTGAGSAGRFGGTVWAGCSALLGRGVVERLDLPPDDSAGEMLALPR